jgi:disulfide bond formation protein DsbB
VPKDELFFRVIRLFVLIIALYGASMSVMLIWGDASLGKVMLSGFSSMFAGLLGFAGGFLLGRD